MSDEISGRDVSLTEDGFVLGVARALMLSGREHYVEAAIRSARGHLGLEADGRAVARLALQMAESADLEFDRLMRAWAAERAK